MPVTSRECPVGLISLYGNGRKNIDIWGDELGFVSAGLKTGTIANHNLLSFGFNPAITDRDVFQLAWHVGRIKTLDEAWNRPSLDRYFVKRDWSFTVLVDGDRDLVDRNHLIRYRYLLGGSACIRIWIIWWTGLYHVCFGPP